MEFIVIMIVAVVTANSISDRSSTIQESKELKNIEQVVKPEVSKQEIARQEASKQEVARKEVDRLIADRLIADNYRLNDKKKLGNDV